MEWKDFGEAGMLNRLTEAQACMECQCSIGIPDTTSLTLIFPDRNLAHNLLINAFYISKIMKLR